MSLGEEGFRKLHDKDGEDSEEERREKANKNKKDKSNYSIKNVKTTTTKTNSFWIEAERTSGDGEETVGYKEESEQNKKKYSERDVRELNDSIVNSQRERLNEIVKSADGLPSQTGWQAFGSHVDARFDKLERTVEDVCSELKEGRRVQEEYRIKQQKPFHRYEHLDSSCDSCEEFTDYSDLECKRKGCRCLCHKGKKSKSFRRAQNNQRKTPKRGNPRKSKSVNMTHTASAGGAGGGDSSGDDSSSESEADISPKGGAGGGGFSGDDSRSESEADISTKEYSKSKFKHLSEGKHRQRWDDVINEKDKKQLKRLIKANKLPHPDQLEKICEVFSRTSRYVNLVCVEICHRIQNLDSDIVKVEPAYKTGFENSIIFIAYLRQAREDLIDNEFGYTVVLRVRGEYLREGKAIVDKEVSQALTFSVEHARELNSCLERNSEALMNKHKNLQMISASHFKSRNYGDDDPEKTVCIVFYVRGKGYIPIAEEPLPDTLDGFPTDVREGGCKFLSKATDRHINLKMGCEIAGEENLNGTLGPFFEQGNNVYCFTAAHVLYGVPQNGETEREWQSLNYGNKPIPVYQPNPGRIPNSVLEKEAPFGSVCRAWYKQGGGDIPGIDVAVVKITDEKRLPNSGDFPEPADGLPMEDDQTSAEESYALRYTSGEICEKEFLRNNNAVGVVKFGAGTGETHGLVHLVGTSVQFTDCMTGDGKGIYLYNQIEFTRTLDDIPFADHGDSGAVILAAYAGNKNDLRALGLLIGKSTTGTVIATPIYSIFDQLKAKSRRFKRFTVHGVQTSCSVDSGVGQSTSSASLPREEQGPIEETKFESLEKSVAENKSETAAVRTEVAELRTDMNTKFDRMMIMMQMLVQNQMGQSRTNDNRNQHNA